MLEEKSHNCRWAIITSEKLAEIMCEQLRVGVPPRVIHAQARRLRDGRRLAGLLPTAVDRHGNEGG